MVSKKIGNISIYTFTLFAIVVMLIIFAFSISYIQITSTVMNIKNDLYNIVQNGIIANDKTELALNSYIGDKNQMIAYIQNLLQKNYMKSNSYIKDIRIEECDMLLDKNDILKHTNGRYDNAIIHLKIKVKFVPVIKIKNVADEVTIQIHEDVKIMLLQYGGT